MGWSERIIYFKGYSKGALPIEFYVAIINRSASPKIVGHKSNY